MAARNKLSIARKRLSDVFFNYPLYCICIPYLVLSLYYVTLKCSELWDMRLYPVCSKPLTTGGMK